MSFLYKARSKPTQANALSHDSDDEGMQNVDFFETKKSKSKVGGKRVAVVNVNEDSNKKNKVGKEVSLVDDDDDDEESRRLAAQQFQQRYQSSAPTNVEVVDLDDSPSNQQGSRASQEIAQKISIMREKLAKSHQQMPSSADYVEEVRPKVQLRRVLTADERQKAADEMAKKMNIRPSSTTATATSSSTQVHDSGEDDDDDEERIAIKTRLAGHEKTWKVKPNDKFGKLKTKIGALYGVSADKFKIKFDGDVLKDDDCPNKLGMEDDDLIDVLMEKSLEVAALNKAKSRS